MSCSIAALTAGGMSPSARFRIRQYIEPLRKEGIRLRELSSGWRGHTQKGSWTHVFGNFATSLARDLINAAASRRYDGAIIQRWAMGSFPTAEFLAGRPRVWDIDDAIWLNAPLSVVRRYAASFDLAICGNAFLAERVSKWNSAVTIIPTGVDSDRFCPDRAIERGETICWSGSKSNLRYLYRIANAIAMVLGRHPGACLRVVCDESPDLPNIDPKRVDFIAWTSESEVGALQSASVGIMPLDDTEWCRGKCSYKMLCSMACGLPVVVSPIGMNSEVLGKGEVGLSATKMDDWVDALDWMLSNPGLANAMGERGREVVLSRYSVKSLVPRLSAVLKATCMPEARN